MGGVESSVWDVLAEASRLLKDKELVILKPRLGLFASLISCFYFGVQGLT